MLICYQIIVKLKCTKSIFVAQRIWTVYTVSQKICANLTMAITLSILNRFVKIFHRCEERQISNKIHISLFPSMTAVCVLAEFGGPNLNGLNNTVIQQTVCCFCTAICSNNKWTVIQWTVTLTKYSSVTKLLKHLVCFSCLADWVLNSIIFILYRFAYVSSRHTIRTRNGKEWELSHGNGMGTGISHNIGNVNGKVFE